MNRRSMKFILMYCLLICFLFSCKKDKEDDATPSTGNESISGKAQKGPFKSGSDVIIYELNNNLEQTGISYSTTTTDDAGSFSFSNINISTDYASVTAVGYFYMEHFNLYSPYKLYLEAVADAQSGSTINVNLLTHLIKPRVEKLVADGSTFSDARIQAQDEFKAFMHMPGIDNTNFEDMNVADNSFLFASSLLFLKNNMIYNTSYNYVNELIHVTNSFRDDFKDNGLIDSQEVIDTLLFNANRTELMDDKTNLETHMTSIGLTSSLSGFEQYIYAFQAAYSGQVYTNFLYPDSAIFYREVASDVHCLNLLNDTSVNFAGGGETYNMAAIVPFDSSLVIKFTMLTSSSAPYNSNSSYYGWKYTMLPDGFTLEAQRKNYANGFLIWLWSTAADSARIDYYMNNQPDPYFSKVIHWQ